MTGQLPLAGLVLLAACGGVDRSAEARAGMMAADSAFDAEVAAGGLEAWVSFFDDSGAMFPNHGPITRGHQAIRRLMAPEFADTSFHLRWKPVFARAGRSGDLGYTIGRYEARGVGPDRKPIVSRGKYITTWKLGANGKWKIVADIGNLDPADAPPLDP